jgi:hypothetical protein
MSIPVVCPNGPQHKVKDRYAGKLRLCPICRAPIHIPGASEAPTEVVKQRKKRRKDVSKKKKPKKGQKKEKKQEKDRFDEGDIMDILMD